jgi:Domain of unknown function (DUF4150)
MADNLAARKDGKWRIVFMAPDFCLTPGSPTPVPYPVTSDLGMSKNVIKSVRLNKKPAFVYDASKAPRTLGDQAGINKGVVSRTVGADCWPMMHSPDTRIGGKWVVRNGELFHMNGNFNKPPGTNLTKKERWEERKRLIEQGKRSADPKVRAAAERLERNNTGVEKAKLAQDIYNPQNGPPEGWKNISNDPEALAKYNLKPSDLQIEGTPSFRAGVYEPDPAVFGSDMKPSVVFQGTNPSSMTDWKNNFAQGLNMNSPYYNQAVHIGNNVSSSGAGVDMVGHSLGGGMASAASRASGTPGWTFNSAGLNPATVPRYGGTTHTPATENINAYQVAGEVLTGLQQQGWKGTLATAGAGAAIGGMFGGFVGAGIGAALGGLAKLGISAAMPDALGNKFPLDGHGNPVSRHGMDQVIDGIEKQKDEDQAIINGAGGG